MSNYTCKSCGCNWIDLGHNHYHTADFIIFNKEITTLRKKFWYLQSKYNKLLEKYNKLKDERKKMNIQQTIKLCNDLLQENKELTRLCNNILMVLFTLSNNKHYTKKDLLQVLYSNYESYANVLNQLNERHKTHGISTHKS